MGDDEEDVGQFDRYVGTVTSCSGSRILHRPVLLPIAQHTDTILFSFSFDSSIRELLRTSTEEEALRSRVVVLTGMVTSFSGSRIISIVQR